MPLNDIHRELYRLERMRWSMPDHVSDQLEREQPSGLRVRLGRAIIAGGRAVAGNALAERPVARHNRPVSAHR